MTLHELTSGENAGRKKAAIMWDDRCHQSLMTLSACAPQHLFFPMQNSPGLLKLHTNACVSGLRGCALPDL